MAEETAETNITPAARFYRLHRDEQLARKKEEYNNRPDVIAKREERRRKQAEKEAGKGTEKMEDNETKEEKREKREKIRQEKLKVALETRRKLKAPTQESKGSLTEFLAESSPAL